METNAGDGDQAESIRLVTRISDYDGANALNSMLIRTDFADEDAWDRLIETVSAPVASPLAYTGWGRTGDLVAISDRTLDGWTPRQLADRIGDLPPHYVFAADSAVMSDLHRGVLAVSLDGGRDASLTVRVAIDVLWMVENSLLTGTMPLQEFSKSAGTDGVFRGFGAAKSTPTDEAPSVLDIRTIAKSELRSLLSADAKTDEQSIVELKSEWEGLDFRELTFYHMLAKTARSIALDLDYSSATVMIGYDETVASLNHGGEVLVGSYEFENGRWELFLDPSGRRFVSAFKYVFDQS